MDGNSGFEKPVRVVVVDDTRSIRAMIRSLLSRSPRIQIVGEAGDPYEAREMIRSLKPDVITLDVVMPHMDGLSFLEKIMRLRPMPVVMVSTRTSEKSEEAVRALTLGAVDCVDIAALGDGNRPKVDLADTVLMAASSRPRASSIIRPVPRTEQRFNWDERFVVIGSSTGGVDALMTVLSDYPIDCPPTVIAQHMPASFLESFTRRLNQNTQPSVVLAEHGQPLEQGKVYVAPGGDRHVALSRHGPATIELVPDDGAQQYVPAIDILFSSAVSYGDKVVGVMLTGMGRDGADALLRMREAGAHTIAQSAETAVVDGMPKAARTIGAAVEVADLQKIGKRILDNVCRQRSAIA